jgi:hypothetical protein
VITVTFLGSTSGTSGVTVAGIYSTAGTGYSELYYPTSIFVDSDGIMYILDQSNFRVVRWLPNEPLGFAVAGGHGYGATLDKMGYCNAIYLDDQSNIYISDSTFHRVTQWSNDNHTSGIRVRIRENGTVFIIVNID